MSGKRVVQIFGWVILVGFVTVLAFQNCDVMGKRTPPNDKQSDGEFTQASSGTGANQITPDDPKYWPFAAACGQGPEHARFFYTQGGIYSANPDSNPNLMLNQFCQETPTPDCNWTDPADPTKTDLTKCCMNAVRPPRDMNGARTWIDKYDDIFDYLQLTALNIDSPVGLKNVRLITQAAKDLDRESPRTNRVGNNVSSIQTKRYFFYNFPRMPSVSYEDPVGSIPETSTWKGKDSHRAWIFKSNGQRMMVYPPRLKDWDSIITISGYNLDITNSVATDAFYQVLRNVFKWRCSSNGVTAGTPYDSVNLDTTCVGPLYGWIVWDETKLTPSYAPFGPNERKHDILKNGMSTPPLVAVIPVRPENENPPRPAGSPTTTLMIPDVAQMPVLKGGKFDSDTNPDVSYRDNHLRMSRVRAPKRAMPLFSDAAVQQYRNFASGSIPYVTSQMCSSLPSDPNRNIPLDPAEFNLGLTSANLPSGFKFLSMTKANLTEWRCWEDWVFFTWRNFMGQVMNNINFAQNGNPDFKGFALFQLPIWYTVRSKLEAPIQFNYPGPMVNTEPPFTYTQEQYNGALQRFEWSSRYENNQNSNPDAQLFEFHEDLAIDKAVDLSMFIGHPNFRIFFHESDGQVGHIPETQCRNTDGTVRPHDCLNIKYSQENWVRTELAKGLQAKGAIDIRNHQNPSKPKVEFGGFARTGWRTSDKSHPHMPPEYWGVEFDHVTAVLNPRYVSTLPRSVYINGSPYQPQTWGGPGPNYDVLRQKMTEMCQQPYSGP